MLNSGIYAIENTVNGKTYIGSAVSLDARRSSHFSMLRGHAHPNRHLQRSFDRHGTGAFKFVVLAYCDPGDLLRLEQSFIDSLHPKFNIARNARAPMLGREHTEETRARISASGKGRVCSEETRRKMRGNKNSLGCHPSEETRRRISEAGRGNRNSLGIHPSEETRRKISEAGRGNENNLGHRASEETRRKMSVAKQGNKNSLGVRPSEETRRKIGEASKSRVCTEETRRKISDANRGRIYTEETRRKIGEAARGNTNCVGRVASAETRLKLRAAQKGKRASEDTRHKLSEVHKGRMQTAEARAKIAAAKREWWQARRQRESQCATS